MINLLVTIFGGLLLIGGFYGMSFGFAAPPNFGLFIIGLISSVFGIILMIFFAGRINLSSKSKSPKSSSKIPRKVKAKDKKGPIERIEKNVKPAVKSSPKIKPTKPKPVKKAGNVTADKKPVKELKEIKPVSTRPVPKKVNQKSVDKDIVEKTTKPPEFSKEQSKRPVTVARGLQSQEVSPT